MAGFCFVLFCFIPQGQWVFLSKQKWERGENVARAQRWGRGYLLFLFLFYFLHPQLQLSRPFNHYRPLSYWPLIGTLITATSVVPLSAVYCLAFYLTAHSLALEHQEISVPRREVTSSQVPLIQKRKNCGLGKLKSIILCYTTLSTQ